MRPHEREVAGLTCGQVLTALSEFADGDVPASVAAQIEAHVAGCGECARFGGSFVSLLAGMRRHLASPEQVDDAVLARVRAALPR